MPDLNHLIREAAALAAAHDAAVANSAVLDPHAGAGATSLAIGARVLDLITGQEAVIVGGHTEQILVPVAPPTAA